jgi:hypothetical protein
MPRPRNERRVLEQERAELPAQSTSYQLDLGATNAEDKTRREMLEWQIRGAQKRLADVEARLAAMRAEA